MAQRGRDLEGRSWLCASLRAYATSPSLWNIVFGGASHGASPHRKPRPQAQESDGSRREKYPWCSYLMTTLMVRSIGLRHWLLPELLNTSATLVLSASLQT